jgi:hypothetical protein
MGKGSIVVQQSSVSYIRMFVAPEKGVIIDCEGGRNHRHQISQISSMLVVCKEGNGSERSENDVADGTHEARAALALRDAIAFLDFENPIQRGLRRRLPTRTIRRR